MTLWLAYVPHGLEFDLVEACEALGITAIVPRKVETVRTGKNRWPEPRVTPYLPNYAFIEATDSEWHWVRDIKYVRDLMGIAPGWHPKLREFFDAVEGQYAAKMAEIESAQRIMRDKEASKEARREAIKAIQSYQPGDLLEVITGPFAGQLAAFGAMVERANSLTPEIEVALQGIGCGVVRGQAFPSYSACARHFGVTVQAVRSAVERGTTDNIGSRRAAE
jgi:transcription antitermination factor NusG